MSEESTTPAQTDRKRSHHDMEEEEEGDVNSQEDIFSPATRTTTATSHPSPSDDVNPPDETATTTANDDDNEDYAIQSAKRQKMACLTEDLLCPIELELPFSPVTAEDGRIYERRAIQKHFQTCRRQQPYGVIKSPMTNQPMGDRLLPAPWMKNHIQHLLDAGLIHDESLTVEWEKKKKWQDQREALLQQAQSGDGESMFRVGRNYLEGIKCFPQDLVKGHEWITKAHQAGCIRATAKLGINLIKCVGVPSKDERLGVMYTSMAAGLGSSMAAYRLGIWFLNGKYGLPRNHVEAKRWLTACLTHEVRDLNKLGREAAVQHLQEIEAAAGGDGGGGGEPNSHQDTPEDDDNNNNHSNDGDNNNSGGELPPPPAVHI